MGHRWMYECTIDTHAPLQVSSAALCPKRCILKGVGTGLLPRKEHQSSDIIMEAYDDMGNHITEGGYRDSFTLEIREEATPETVRGQLM